MNTKTWKALKESSISLREVREGLKDSTDEQLAQSLETHVKIGLIGESYAALVLDEAIRRLKK